MRNNNKMQEMVQLYNDSPHMAYNNLFTPTEVQENQEIEGRFIAYKQRELRQALHSQKRDDLHNYKKNNILFFHLDVKKTD